MRAGTRMDDEEEARVAGIDVAIMIEGQDGLTWPRWQRLARAAEELGFAGLYRSDHFTNADRAAHRCPRALGLADLAGQPHRPDRVRADGLAGLLPPPGRTSPGRPRAIDDLSGGRLRLGLGAGWQEREHRSFGFDLLDLDGRFARLEEAPPGRHPPPPLRRAGRLHRPLLPPGRRPAPAPSGPTRRSADRHRRQRAAADPAAGRPLRRRVERASLSPPSGSATSARPSTSCSAPPAASPATSSGR